MNDWGVEASKGLSFKRSETGVTVSYHPNEDGPPEAVFNVDAAVWAYVVAYVSKLGTVPVIIEAAKILHEGTEDHG